MLPGNSVESFRNAFCALGEGREPFPWQEELFRRFLGGDIPSLLNLPTGCGKTSAMVVWLIALAHQAEFGQVSLPRRLVWVVNRRVVVDQATEEAERIRQRLQQEGVVGLDTLRAALSRLSASNTGDLLAVSTLRGQFADNAEWRRDPSRPAIIAGTVDMIGSRLLFSGYGCGFKSRPLHAAFLGQDALLVHDEAHLEPAFQHLIGAIESEQARCRDFRPIRVLALSATSRAVHSRQFTLSPADRENPEIRKRVEAGKGVAFHPLGDETRLAAEVCRLALDFSNTGQAVLIFLRKLDDVQSVVDGLRRENLQVQSFTGTLRGYERDELARSDAVLARFLPGSTAAPCTGTVYLVSTSAGEVGINMSADHAVCDLVPFDSMVQRFGRVNRFGAGDARIEVLYSNPPGDDKAPRKKAGDSRFQQACERTLALLQRLPQSDNGRYNASPAALEDLPLEARQDAFTPPPEIPAVSDILFDAWSLTSVRDKFPGRPPVAAWLHGVAEWEPPQTYLAWRQEVAVITPRLLLRYQPEDLLEDYPLKPAELLRDASSRIAGQLGAIAQRCPDLSVWLVEPAGSVQVLPLTALLSNDPSYLDGCTVLLPPLAGGLNRGMLDGNAPFDEQHSDRYDVSESCSDEHNNPLRRRLWDSHESPPGMRLVRVIDTRPDAGDEGEEEQLPPAPRYWYWYVRPRSADDDGSLTAIREQDLDPHCAAVRDAAQALASALGLGATETRALIAAASWHDLGKRRALWQRSIGNGDFPQRILAKSGSNLILPGLSGYRHEFGSLLDVLQLPDFLQLEPPLRDLVLHLIAVHHGRGRPHFPEDESFDPEYPAAVALEAAREVPRRFARLQRQYGRWGLAYLESLVRAADALASQGVQCPARPLPPQEPRP